MKILSIETSCDETAAAIIEKKNNETKILSNIIFSQIKIHKKFGGVVPNLASRAHLEKIIPAIKEALTKAKTNLNEIDAIACTTQPGLFPTLIIGIETAKTLAFFLKKPLIKVDHLKAHIYANWLVTNHIRQPAELATSTSWQNRSQIFPAISLVVSGGHTELFLMKDCKKFKKIGQTLDDAAGEAFDKIARILGLGYPGGPAIAKQAYQWKSQIQNHKFQKNSKSQIPNIKLPRPVINSKNYNFSFSGLKTAVLYDYQKRSLKIKKSKTFLQKMAYETQQAIIDVLIFKTLKAAKNFKAKTIFLGGGVAANQELRKQFKLKIKKEIPNSKFYIPNSKLCTDNAAMIGIAALM